jgi:hypothetical protein
LNALGIFDRLSIMALNMTIKKMISALGGPKAVAHKYNVTTTSVYAWVKQGIPIRFWPELLKVGYSLEEVFQADQKAKQKLRKRKSSLTV